MRGKKLATLKTILASLFVMSMVFIMGTATAEAAPAKVTGLKQMDASTTSVQIQWTPTGTSGYVVEYSQDKVTWETESISKNSDTIYGLNAGSTYFVRVKAVSNGQYGAYSDIVEVVTAPDVTTQNVVQVDATSSTVTLSWDPVPGATSYDVYYGSYESPSLGGSTTQTAYTITGIPADSYFSVFVLPKRTAVTAPNYTAVYDDIYTYGVITTGGPLYIDVTDRDPRKKVGSKKNSDYNTLEIAHGIALFADGYEVTVYKSNGKSIKKVVDAPNSIFATVKNIKTTETVWVQVRSYTYINGVKKYGDYSDKLLSVGSPTAKATQKGNGVKISWSKVPGAKKYEVYMSKSSKSGYKKVKTVKSGTRSVVLNSFKGKKFVKWQNYYYYVKAVGTYGKKKNAKSDIPYYKYFYFYTKY